MRGLSGIICPTHGSNEGLRCESCTTHVCPVCARTGCPSCGGDVDDHSAFDAVAQADGAPGAYYTPEALTRIVEPAASAGGLPCPPGCAVDGHSHVEPALSALRAAVGDQLDGVDGDTRREPAQSWLRAAAGDLLDDADVQSYQRVIRDSARRFDAMTTATEGLTTEQLEAGVVREAFTVLAGILASDKLDPDEHYRDLRALILRGRAVVAVRAAAEPARAAGLDVAVGA